jgi:hypothetical protein
MRIIEGRAGGKRFPRPPLKLPSHPPVGVKGKPEFPGLPFHFYKICVFLYVIYIMMGKNEFGA